jgi:hypothetical protein
MREKLRHRLAMFPVPAQRLSLGEYCWVDVEMADPIANPERDDGMSSQSNPVIFQKFILQMVTLSLAMPSSSLSLFHLSLSHAIFLSNIPHLLCRNLKRMQVRHWRGDRRQITSLRWAKETKGSR